MCQVDTSESLEGIFPGGLINRGKFDSLYEHVQVFCSQTSSW